MRTILFFDLPTLSSSDLKNYRNFVKLIKKSGFYMLQKSVYVKMSIDFQAVNSTIKKIKNNIPLKGNIMIINVTEKQFSSMEILLGDNPTDIITSNERIIQL